MINEGPLDRAIRIAVGAAILALVFVGPKSLFGLIGIVPLATGVIGFCPLYQLVGLNTCPVSSRHGGA